MEQRHAARMPKWYVLKEWGSLYIKYCQNPSKSLKPNLRDEFVARERAEV